MKDLPAQDGADFALRFLSRRKIADARRGFTEPSGLTIGQGDVALWSVSDDTNALFALDRKGRLRPQGRLPLPVSELEGVALSADGRRMVAVREEGDRVLDIALPSGRIRADRRLSRMVGFGAVAPLLLRRPRNKGLEGVAILPDGTVAAVIEGRPRVLLLLAPGLTRILAHRVLSAAAGFADPDVADAALDVSGLSPAGAGRLWILSDRGARLFLYDIARHRACGVALGYRSKKGRWKRVEDAEGVAYDAEARQLFIVTDRGAKSRLYRYAVEGLD